MKEILPITASAEEIASRLTGAGLEVGAVEQRGDDYLLEAEVTTNRYDWLSLVGIAYEISALFQKKMVFPKAAYRLPEATLKTIEIKNPKDCFLYYGARVEQITVGPSPEFIANRLTCSGIRPINNVVDITNYCMLKWGQPLHAFDQDTLHGKIVVRRAKDEEKLTTLDGREYVLKPDMLVIADEQSPVAIAGIMGGKNTEITSASKKVFLEAAIFNPLVIRRGRRMLGVSTDSSYRFERSVHPPYTLEAFREVLWLLEKYAGGKLSVWGVAGKIPGAERKRIIFSPAQLEKHIGVSPSTKTIKNILSLLGMTVAVRGSKISVTPPAYRRDVCIREDVFEEVARIYGYEKIPPRTPFFKKNPSSFAFRFKGQIRQKLISLGFQEVITYSFSSAAQEAFSSKDELIALVNPLRSEENLLRNTLCSGMLKTIQYNLFQKEKNISFFEIGNVFGKGDSAPQEQTVICLGMSAQSKNEFFSFKGKIHGFFAMLGEKVTFRKEMREGFSGYGLLFVGEKHLGFLGRLSGEFRKAAGLSEEVFIAEFSLKLLSEIARQPLFREFSLYPAIERDISMALHKNGDFSEVEKLVRKQLGVLLERFEVIDIYEGKSVPENFIGFTLRIYYRDKTRTLTSGEIDTLHTSLRQAIASRENFLLR